MRVPLRRRALRRGARARLSRRSRYAGRCQNRRRSATACARAQPAVVATERGGWEGTEPLAGQCRVLWLVLDYLLITIIIGYYVFQIKTILKGDIPKIIFLNKFYDLDPFGKHDFQTSHQHSDPQWFSTNACIIIILLSDGLYNYFIQISAFRSI